MVGTPAVFDCGVPRAAWIYEDVVPWDLAQLGVSNYPRSARTFTHLPQPRLTGATALSLTVSSSPATRPQAGDYTEALAQQMPTAPR